MFLLVVTASVPASGQANGVAPAGSTSQWQWRSVQAQGEPHARHENSMAAIGERLYVLGGRGERPLDIFDTRTRRWSRGSAPPLAVNHAQAAVWAGKLYLVGGFTGDYPNETALTHLLIYDPATDRWQVGAEIPADRRRGSAGTVAHDGVLYLVGGNTRGHNSGYVPWLDAFDTRTQRWTRLPDAPHARDHFHRRQALRGRRAPVFARHRRHAVANDPAAGCLRSAAGHLVGGRCHATDPARRRGRHRASRPGHAVGRRKHGPGRRPCRSGVLRPGHRAVGDRSGPAARQARHAGGAGGRGSLHRRRQRQPRRRTGTAGPARAAAGALSAACAAGLPAAFSVCG
ncbi:ring canal kelch-like protein [Xanthomonas citri pv. malvacearum str. GSPB1386]|nr:ring canal kelch-like protein [Xanthomonas citri pv. malvacearum str. GSPB1386]